MPKKQRGSQKSRRGWQRNKNESANGWQRSLKRPSCLGKRRRPKRGSDSLRSGNAYKKKSKLGMRKRRGNENGERKRRPRKGIVLLKRKRGSRRKLKGWKRGVSRMKRRLESCKRRSS
jgi:hypothetical protein